MNDQTTPESTPTAGSDAAAVTAPGPVTTAESPTPEQLKRNRYVILLAHDGLVKLVNDCPADLLKQLYNAGPRIQQLVNQRWERGEPK